MAHIKKKIHGMKGRKAQSKGMMAIGVLILFIAIIVVSAVAAAVLIGAGGSLEQRSVASLKGTEQEVATGLSVYSMVGSDGSVDGTINNIEMLVRLRPGSDPVGLNSTIITVDSRELFATLEYGDGSPGTYSVYYLRRGGVELDGYINLGDSAVLNITLDESIGPDERLLIQIIPGQGAVRRIGFTTPSVMIDKRVFLFP
jgi:archaellin